MLPPSIFLAAESLLPGNGGICRVARLMAKVLAEEVQQKKLRMDGLVLSDPTEQSEFAFPVATAKGSRLRFALRQNVAPLNHRHFIYDFEAMARVHCPLRPFMTWIHGIEVWEGADPKRIRTAQRANFLLCNSAYTRNRAERIHGGFTHAKVCWLATEADEPSILRKDASGPPTVLILGRIDQRRYKGHDALIDCWAQVHKAVPDARLVMVGRGPGLESLKQRAAASPASDNIDVLGFVPDEQMDRIWGQTTVFAMPSLGEGFGLVYIEAMRHGIPVIASIHDAAPEVNIDGQTGYNVDLNVADHLLDRLILLLKNQDHAKSLGMNGKQRWHEHFRYSAFRQRFLQHLQEFLKST